MIFQEQSLEPRGLHSAARTLIDDGAYLAGMVCCDDRHTEGCFTIRYFFFSEAGGMKTLVLKTEESFPSLSGITPAAKLYEREIAALFGLRPENHPDPRPLMLFPENWDPAVFPLRRGFDGRPPELKQYGSYRYKRVEGEGITEIPVGPIHAGVIEPGHFRFSIKGEPVLQLEIRHFWKHRGVEKLCEGKTPQEALPLIGRISGDNHVNISLAFLLAAEDLAGVSVPPRAWEIRLIYAELERIWNHVRDIGWFFMDIGFTLPAQNLFALQEELMRLNRTLTGHRFMFDALVTGGVARDLDEADRRAVRGLLKKVEEELREYEQLVRDSPAAMDRFVTTGRIFQSTALDLSLCGVCARASGLRRDTRIELPYGAYAARSLTLPVYDEGDVFARLCVRIQEIHASLRLVLDGIDTLPDGPLRAADPSPCRRGMASGNAETPRGNAFVFLATGDDGRITRLKYIDPSFRNWPAIQYAVIGDIVADFPLVNKSMNLSYAGNDL